MMGFLEHLVDLTMNWKPPAASLARSGLPQGPGSTAVLPEDPITDKPGAISGPAASKPWALPWNGRPYHGGGPPVRGDFEVS